MNIKSGVESTLAFLLEKLFASSWHLKLATQQLGGEQWPLQHQSLQLCWFNSASWSENASFQEHYRGFQRRPPSCPHCRDQPGFQRPRLCDPCESEMRGHTVSGVHSVGRSKHHACLIASRLGERLRQHHESHLKCFTWPSQGVHQPVRNCVP